MNERRDHLSIFRSNRIKADTLKSGFESTGGTRAAGFRLAPDSALFESGFYEALRDSVPIIDACISKIVRLTSDFRVVCANQKSQSFIDDFVQNVPLGESGSTLAAFADMYLDALLTYGKSIGEYVTDERTGLISELFVHDPTVINIKRRCGAGQTVLTFVGSEEPIALRHPQRILYTTLNPTPKSPQGRSLLRGLPALSDILLTIYKCIGMNFERAGNIRYAVTYKPKDEGDAQFARTCASEIAKQWTDGMQSAKAGVMKDFVAVGDVDIKVIGAENGLIDTQIPVRQITEQMISKLSIPPFLLGLSWSSTERMASQQADILTSELEYYRRLITPVLLKICRYELAAAGLDRNVSIEWGNINLQDEEALARARLYNAQAAELERRMNGGENGQV